MPQDTEELFGAPDLPGQRSLAHWRSLALARQPLMATLACMKLVSNENTPKTIWSADSWIYRENIPNIRVTILKRDEIFLIVDSTV